MTDDALSTLKLLRTGAPSPEARKLALNAAMVAFDKAQPKAAARKGGWLNRWTMGAGLGVPLTTAVAALVLLPLGTQLYTATSHRMEGQPPVAAPATTAAAAPQAKASASVAPTAPANAAAGDAEGRVAGSATTMTQEAAPAMDQLAAGAPPVAAAPMTRAFAVPKAIANATMSGMAQPVPYQQSGDTFQKFTENGVKVTAADPVSTFSIDVDTASYAYVRSVLKDGYLPAPDAVRLEELINYFPYDYPAPASQEVPFKATMAVIPTPWNPRTQLLEIGIKGYVPPPAARQPENLTFLIDTSGSMDEPNKLPLLKRAFGLLVDTLGPDDTVSIVTYAGSAGIALKPTRASDRGAILGAIDALSPEGATNGADGIALAYEVNAGARADGTVNRVILATDGDFNVGIDQPDQLKAYIKTQRDRGISLSVLGFGRGNLDDALMQALAQNGNGNASYIDNFQEAQKVLVEEGGANLVTIAKDVKIQVEFNPAQISEYRLIGYETRALANEDFNNDKVDAGDIGAGHTVTALYEITPVGSGAELNDPLRYGASSAAPAASSDELGFLKIRYKAPEGDASKLITAPITKDLVVGELAAAGNDQRFAAAVAAFGQKLKGSAYGETLSWQQIADLANGAKGSDADGYRAEFVQLVKVAALLAPDHAGGGKSVYDDPTGGKTGTSRTTGARPVTN
ncbi:VWA domain-containing protein [Devosia sp. 67-54]|nr:VWA domain-containing protein [Devosia sp. 67-54]MBN9306775.1 VWA domain-containing protein [Devosia sp.]